MEPHPVMKDAGQDGAPAVTRALDLLETLGRSGQGLTLSELSRRLNIPKSTTHYLITTLCARGYLQRIPWTRQYSLGVRAFDFTPNGVAELRLRQFCAPKIRSLADKVRNGVQVAVLKGDEGMALDRATAEPLALGGTLPGHHFHLHCTAAGKALIAWLPEPELEKLFPNRFLCKFTPQTITAFDHLKAHLADVRCKRYAVNLEEYHLNRRAVAAPVFDDSGGVIASISVYGSTSDIPVQRILDLADKLVAAGADISRQLLAQQPLTSRSHHVFPGS
jgi:IclR family acetate operon transcriptional repressor